jgi:hypothetical protein
VRWFRRAAQPEASPDGGLLPVGTDADTDTEDEIDFVCSTCGRTDLPRAGAWEPPICIECDAEVNFAAIEEVEITEDW